MRNLLQKALKQKDEIINNTGIISSSEESEYEEVEESVEESEEEEDEEPEMNIQEDSQGAFYENTEVQKIYVNEEEKKDILKHKEEK